MSHAVYPCHRKVLSFTLWRDVLNVDDGVFYDSPPRIAMYNNLHNLSIVSNYIVNLCKFFV